MLVFLCPVLPAKSIIRLTLAPAFSAGRQFIIEGTLQIQGFPWIFSTRSTGASVLVTRSGLVTSISGNANSYVYLAGTNVNLQPQCGSHIASYTRFDAKAYLNHSLPCAATFTGASILEMLDVNSYLFLGLASTLNVQGLLNGALSVSGGGNVCPPCLSCVG